MNNLKYSIDLLGKGIEDSSSRFNAAEGRNLLLGYIMDRLKLRAELDRNLHVSNASLVGQFKDKFN